jgi:hypothetical protein
MSRVFTFDGAKSATATARAAQKTDDKQAPLHASQKADSNWGSFDAAFQWNVKVHMPECDGTDACDEIKFELKSSSGGASLNRVSDISPLVMGPPTNIIADPCPKSHTKVDLVNLQILGLQSNATIHLCYFSFFAIQ